MNNKGELLMGSVLLIAAVCLAVLAVSKMMEKEKPKPVPVKDALEQVKEQAEITEDNLIKLFSDRFEVLTDRVTKQLREERPSLDLAHKVDANRVEINTLKKERNYSKFESAIKELDERIERLSKAQSKFPEMIEVSVKELKKKDTDKVTVLVSRKTGRNTIVRYKKIIPKKVLKRWERMFKERNPKAERIRHAGVVR